MHLVDTNVVSELMKPRPNRGVLTWASTIGRCSISVIAVDEIWLGLEAKPSARMDLWFSAFLEEHCEIVDVTRAIARRSAALRAKLRAAGHVRAQADTLIAATAAELDIILVTRNERDFEGCDIRLLNPFR